MSDQILTRNILFYKMCFTFSFFVRRHIMLFVVFSLSEIIRTNKILRICSNNRYRMIFLNTMFTRRYGQPDWRSRKKCRRFDQSSRNRITGKVIAPDVRTPPHHRANTFDTLKLISFVYFFVSNFSLVCHAHLHILYRNIRWDEMHEIQFSSCFILCIYFVIS